MTMLVCWREADGSAPTGRPAQLEVRWLDQLPLPAIGEFLTTETGVLLEVMARTFEVSLQRTPRPVLNCRRVGP